MKLQSTYLLRGDTGAGLNAALIGAKAWNLARLDELGAPVPRWFVLTTQAFDDLLGSRRDTIQKILVTVNFTRPADLTEAAARIAALIAAVEIPAPLCVAWLAALERRFGAAALFSVRSSVIGEDSFDHSFAGQMESFLNVPLVQIVERVKQVWASAFSARALAYRKQKGLELSPIAIAVIVQEMVQAAQSGVLFTREPESGAQRCVICAGYGLGEGVVADKVECDTYRIEWNSRQIDKRVPVKQSRVVAGRAPAYGNCVEAVPLAIQSRAVLTDSQIFRLHRAAMEVAGSFGTAQDIEWAFDGRGRLYLLQTRPITTGPNQQRSPAVRIWDNSNVVESYPGLTLPLTFSFARSGYETSFRPFARRLALGFFPFRNSIQERLHIFKNMIGLHDGRIYYNLLHWYEMLSFLPGFEKRKRCWDQMIGIERKIAFPHHQLSAVNQLCCQALLLWILLTVKPTAAKFFAHFAPVYGRFKDVDLSHASEHELIEIYEALSHKLADKWALTLNNDICAMTYYDWLKRLCAEWGLATTPNIHNDLLCGERGIESVAPVRSLARLAEMARANSEYAQLLSAGSDRAAWNLIQTDRRYGAFKIACERHVSEFGDRGFEELKLDRPTLSEQPERLIQMIRQHLTSAITVEAMEAREREIRDNAEKEARALFGNPCKRLIFCFVLRNARRAIANRENMRFARSRLFGITRRLFRRMGQLFAEKGILQTADDIHYLTVEEIFAFVQGTSVTRNLKALVDLRRAEYAAFARRAPAARFETVGLPYLNSVSGAEATSAAANQASGIGCSSGTAQGSARVVLDPQEDIPTTGQILVARSTDPGWVFLMIGAKGIVAERGSVLSHTAIIGRELGIPTIVGVKDATQIIPDGAPVAMDGSTGEIRWQSVNSLSAQL